MRKLSAVATIVIGVIGLLEAISLPASPGNGVQTPVILLVSVVGVLGGILLFIAPMRRA